MSSIKLFIVLMAFGISTISTYAKCTGTSMSIEEEASQCAAKDRIKPPMIYVNHTKSVSLKEIHHRVDEESLVAEETCFISSTVKNELQQKIMWRNKTTAVDESVVKKPFDIDAKNETSFLTDAVNNENITVRVNVQSYANRSIDSDIHLTRFKRQTVKLANKVHSHKRGEDRIKMNSCHRRRHHKHIRHKELGHGIPSVHKSDVL